VRQGKNAFPEIINDPICHIVAISMGLFSEILFENKGAKTRVLDANDISVLTCRAQKLYRNHGIANNAMLRTLLIRVT